MFGHHKFGGNAQSITKNRWIHHTSFLWDFDVNNMAYLRLPTRAPKYRSVCFFFFFVIVLYLLFFIFFTVIISLTTCLHDHNLFLLATLVTPWNLDICMELNCLTEENSQFLFTRLDVLGPKSQVPISHAINNLYEFPLCVCFHLCLIHLNKMEFACM